MLRNSSDEGIEKTPGRYVSELYGTPPQAGALPRRSGQRRPRRKPVVMVAAAVAVPIAPPAASAAGSDRGDPREHTKTVEIIPRGN